MKRKGNLYSLLTKAALMQGFIDASKSKRNNRGCFNFERNLGYQLESLHKELHSNTYQPRPYFSFVITEPKRRVIYAPAFRDCVVQHAIYSLTRPIFEATFIDQSYACRKGLGTHKCADYAQNALQNIKPGSYVLQLDIRKFFYRIDREILKRLIEKKIKDKRFIDLMMMFTDHGETMGIPIGNLLSQLYALIYLNTLDHYIKRELKVKYYCRYVDDFILFGITQAQGIEYRHKIIEFIDSELNLELSKSTLAKAKKGVNFVGYRTWSSKRFIRKRCLYNFRKALKHSKIESAASILGHARKTHSLKYLINYTKEYYNANYYQLPKIYQH